MIKDLLRVKKIFEEIQGVTSTKAKVHIIEKNKNDKLFKYLLNFLLDTNKITGISKKKINKKVNLTLSQRQLNNIVQLCEYVLENNTGTDVVLATTNNYINKHDENIANFIKEIITKSLKLGVDSKLVNKAISGLIPTFEVMLAEGYDIKHVDGKDFIITLKLDGIRMICIKENENIRFYSKQGKLIDGLIEIEQEMKLLPNGVYDGELLAKGIFSESKEQYKETIKRVRIKGEKVGLNYVVYDYIKDISDFRNEYCSTPCINRKSNLHRIINSLQIQHNCNCIIYLNPMYIGNDTSKIHELLKIVQINMQEGLMINLCNSPYEAKRVNHLLKVKVMQSVDLRVIGVQEGTGKNKGKLGALIVEYKGFEVKVGSGFTDKLRQQIWDNQSDIIGKIIEVQYFEQTKNKDNQLSLRFPVFLQVREDKIEPSYH